MFLSLCMALPAKAITAPTDPTATFTLLNDNTGLPSGFAGDTVTAIGTGFQPGDDIYITAYAGAIGPSDIPTAVPYPDINNVDIVTADGAGGFELDGVELGPMPGGVYTIVVSDTSGNVAFQLFTILGPSITLSQSSGPMGTVVTVTGTGFDPGDIADGNGNTLACVIASATYGNEVPSTPYPVPIQSDGTFTATFTVPNDIGIGPCIVAFVDYNNYYGNTAFAQFTVTPSFAAPEYGFGALLALVACAAAFVVFKKREQTHI